MKKELLPQVNRNGIGKGNSGVERVRREQSLIMALQQISERKDQLKLDISLCRVAGELGTAMKHAFELGDQELYEQLRAQRLVISDLRDSFRANQADYQ
jgi:hypothetical protein